MHRQQIQFLFRMKAMFPDYFRKSTVYDIGSADVNGNLKWLFKGCNYFGVDIWPGKNVDILWDEPYPFSFRGHTYISCECLEHDSRWKETIQGMVEGVVNCLIITCAGIGRPEHGTTRTSPEDSPATTDYYRNLSISNIQPLVEDHFRYFKFWYNPISHDLYFIGFKQTPKFRPSLVRYILLELEAFYRMRIRDFKNIVTSLKISGR